MLLRKLEISPYHLTATDIRNVYASMLLSKGIDIWVVTHVIGHKNIKQVTETYGHLLKDKKEKEYQIIRNLLSEYR
ncbi:tyrosine-type recombinase/integrase [Falseniella ignava]